MNFIFFCSKTGKTFETNAFRIAGNKGIKTDPSGTRYLDAEVILTDPCPFCSEQHKYAASELSCPFNGSL